MYDDIPFWWTGKLTVWMWFLDWYYEQEAYNILANRIFLKTLLTDSTALKKRWPVDVSEILTMYLIAENLVNDWHVIKDEFKKTKTLKDKHLLIAMVHQPWELCDDTFTEWSAANKITLPAKNTLPTVAAKYLYSNWVWFLCCISQIVYTTIPHP